VWSSEEFMKDATPCIYRKMMLEITSYNSLWVFMNPLMAISGIVDSIVDELCLVNE
jgi:hypothetical protein